MTAPPAESPDAAERLRRDRERDYAKMLAQVEADRAKREKRGTDER